MSEKIVVVKAGFDATTETNPNNMNYSSDYNTLKYYAAGSTQLIGSAVFPNTNNYFGTILHNLGYYPYFSVYVNDATNSIYYPNSYRNVGAGLTQYSTLLMGSTALVFFMSLTNTSGGTLFGTANFYYKLFINNLGF